MKIIKEISLENFNAWGGATETLRIVSEAGLCDELESLIEEENPDGMTAGELNDYLWFYDDDIFRMLGLNPYGELEEE